MGTFTVKGFIGLDERSGQEVDFLVDTGPIYTFLPPNIAQELGIITTVPGRVVLADTRVQQVKIGVAYLRIWDREGGVPVSIMNVPLPLLGATALEILGFKVNPVERRLEYSRPFGPAAL